MVPAESSDEELTTRTVTDQKSIQSQQLGPAG